MWLVVSALTITAAPSRGAFALVDPRPRQIPAGVVQNLATIPVAAWDQTSGVDVRPPVAVAPVAGTSVGREPLVLYLGAEYCPYCATQRWPIIVALSRFGSFHGLEAITSSASGEFAGTATFTFHHATYESPYVVVQTAELQTNIRGPDHSYPSLETPTPAQLQLYRHYNTLQRLPFLLVGGRYLWIDSSFSPALFAGLTWTSVAELVHAGHGRLAQAILATALQITAAVCATNGGRPTAVCAISPVRAAITGLPVPRGR